MTEFCTIWATIKPRNSCTKMSNKQFFPVSQRMALPLKVYQFLSWSMRDVLHNVSTRPNWTEQHYVWSYIQFPENLSKFEQALKKEGGAWWGFSTLSTLMHRFIDIDWLIDFLSTQLSGNYYIRRELCPITWWYSNQLQIQIQDKTKQLKFFKQNT